MNGSEFQALRRVLESILRRLVSITTPHLLRCDHPARATS